MNTHQDLSTACDLVTESASYLTKPSRILDLACGGGRNGQHLLSLGHNVVFLDKDIAGLSHLKCKPNAEIIEADLENGDPWPLGDRKFDAVLVVNYLWRPIMGDIINSVIGGGVLIYETFGVGNEKYGRPSNPKFLLSENEMPNMLMDNFDIVRYQHGFVESPKPAIKQSVIALKKP